MDSTKDSEKTSLEKFLTLLSEDQGEASVIYEDLRQRLSRFFLLRGILDSMEAADETIDRVISKYDKGEAIQHYLKYAYGVGRNVLLERIREEKLRKAGEAELQRKSEGGYLGEDRDDNSESELLIRFKSCLEGISEFNRNLLAQYFSQEGNNRDYREKIAKYHGMNILALRARIYRIKKDLENCLKQKM